MISTPTVLRCKNEQLTISATKRYSANTTLALSFYELFSIHPRPLQVIITKSNWLGILKWLIGGVITSLTGPR